MRELIYFIASLAGAAVLTAVAALVRVPEFWRRVLYVAGFVLCLCSAWLLIDFLAAKGVGMWIGLNQPIWLRGLLGAIAGAFIWTAITTFHSNAQLDNPNVGLPSGTNPPGPAPVILNLAKDVTMKNVTTIGTGTGIENRGEGLRVQNYQGIQVPSGPSINTINQSGGTNTINVGPVRLVFDLAIAEELVAKLPAGKPISLQSVGSSADQAVADQYEQFLQSRGFQTQRVRIGVMGPPPDHKITLGDPNAPQMVVLIAPSAN
jgi:hypothetical protein